MRGRGKRSWIKIWVTGWLHGSIRWQLDPSERGVWADLIVLAGECSQEGAICDNDSRPYPRDFIANQLNIPQELLDRTIAKCRREGRVEDRDDIIIISNWQAYQSEYDRVKKYRATPAEDPDKYVKGKYSHRVKR
ncbi:MAG: phage replisome organizer N-terminal domain-containing protein [Dehalococcoidia bacterium]|nr:phage replisome organizer N-terminal domain-containing protein [Dehalococcoidia bacterium]